MDAWGAHLCQHLVEPLQRAVQVELDPAGGAGHCLPPGTHTQTTDGEDAEPAALPVSKHIKSWKNKHLIDFSPDIWHMQSNWIYSELQLNFLLFSKTRLRLFCELWQLLLHSVIKLL